jgi:hypothetical protein
MSSDTRLALGLLTVVAGGLFAVDDIAALGVA